MLIAVPGGSDGPGGVLVVSENCVVWKNQGHQEVRAALPRRKVLGEDRSVLIVSATAHKQKVHPSLILGVCSFLFQVVLSQIGFVLHSSSKRIRRHLQDHTRLGRGQCQCHQAQLLRHCGHLKRHVHP